MTTTTSPLDQIERSYCDCSRCKAGCLSAPGSLAPGDAERIAEHLDVPLEHLAEHSLAASDGAVVIFRGQTRRIPTIVPQQREDLSCVFFDRQSERCAIHDVSPYGCAKFNVCDNGESPEEEIKKVRAQLTAIAFSEDYQTLRTQLVQTGNVAPPLRERKKKMLQLLDAIDEQERDQSQDQSQE